MIWTYIFDFFIQYIFGGIDSHLNYYDCFIYRYSSGGSSWDINTNNAYIDLFDGRMPFGNYLSLIATIIVMALIVWFAVWLTIWVFKLVSHAFLLK